MEDVKKPQLQDGEVLIKVECSSVHPADAMMVQGVYSRGATFPFRVGLVGIGHVIERKKTGFSGWLIRNKRVVFAMPQGTFGSWAECITTLPSLCFPLPDALPSEAAVNLLSNGATAVGVVKFLKKARTRGAIITGAAGDFGRLVRHQLRAEGMIAICVVRSHKQVMQLSTEGEKYVLDFSLPDFDDQLAKLTSSLSITGAVDTIAGNLPERLLRAMPLKTNVIMIGRLSGEKIEVDAMEPMISKSGTILGFNIDHWYESQSMISALIALRQASKLLLNFPPPEPKYRYSLQEVVENFDKTITRTTAGKTLIYPHK